MNHGGDSSDNRNNNEDNPLDVSYSDGKSSDYNDKFSDSDDERDQNNNKMPDLRMK